MPWAVVELPKVSATSASGCSSTRARRAGARPGLLDVSTRSTTTPARRHRRGRTPSRGQQAFQAQRRSRVPRPARSPSTATRGSTSNSRCRRTPTRQGAGRTGRSGTSTRPAAAGTSRPGHADRLWILDVDGDLVILQCGRRSGLPKPAPSSSPPWSIRWTSSPGTDDSSPIRPAGVGTEKQHPAWEVAGNARRSRGCPSTSGVRAPQADRRQHWLTLGGVPHPRIRLSGSAGTRPSSASTPPTSHVSNTTPSRDARDCGMSGRSRWRQRAKRQIGRARLDARPLAQESQSLQITSPERGAAEVVVVHQLAWRVDVGQTEDVTELV